MKTNTADLATISAHASALAAFLDLATKDDQTAFGSLVRDVFLQLQSTSVSSAARSRLRRTLTEVSAPRSTAASRATKDREAAFRRAQLTLEF